MKIARYIVGAISGLTFGMLFAPKEGKKLRKELKKKGNSADSIKVLSDAFKSAGDEAVKELKDLAEHEQVSAMLELSQDKMKAFLEGAEERGYDVAVQVQEHFEGLAEMAKEKVAEARKTAKVVEKQVDKKVKMTKRKVGATKRKAARKVTKVAKKTATASKRVTKTANKVAKKATKAAKPAAKRTVKKTAKKPAAKRTAKKR